MSKAQSTASILVVDDDPEIVAMLTTRLSARGYKVSTANDGHRALTLAKRERPDSRPDRPRIRPDARPDRDVRPTTDRTDRTATTTDRTDTTRTTSTTDRTGR